MSYFNDFVCRLRRNWGWVGLQFGLTLVLLLVGLAWTRLPEKHVWQVALTLLAPLLLAISLLELEAGTMRSLADDGKRVKLVWGAMALLVWVALFWACWAALDWCDEQVPMWAGYLNSRASAGGRATIFTYMRIQLWLTDLEWLLRWVVVPAKIIPYAMSSSQWGWRLPWRRIIRFLFNWRWWVAAIAAALVAVELPGHFFTGTPQGTVSHQVWAVGFKLAGTYLLAVASWVALLAWAAVLMARQPEPAEGTLDEKLFRTLGKSRGAIGMLACWLGLGVTVGFALSRGQGKQAWDVSPSSVSTVIAGAVLIVGLIVLQVMALRAMMKGDGKPSRLIGGVLSVLIWVLVALIAITLVSLCRSQVLRWVLDWFVITALLVPFGVASAQWGFHIPW